MTPKQSSHSPQRRNYKSKIISFLVIFCTPKTQGAILNPSRLSLERGRDLAKCEKCAEYAGSDLMGLGNLFEMYFGTDSILRQKKGGGANHASKTQSNPHKSERTKQAQKRKKYKLGRGKNLGYFASYFFASPLICLTLLALFHLPDFTRLASSAADFPCIF